MLFRRLSALALIALAALLPLSAKASQGSGCLPTTGTVSGLTIVQNINAGVAALISTNSGASPPATDCTTAPVKGQLWLNTTSSSRPILSIYDGNSWLPLGTMDATNHLWLPALGGGSATIASATTTDLGSTAESYLTISGTTAITSLGSTAPIGTIKALKFSGALTLTYNATSLIVPSAATITTRAGDTAFAVALGSGNWLVLTYTRADGTPIVNTSIGSLTTLASASTTDLGTIASHNVSVTGTTTITSFGSSANTALPFYKVSFAGALTLTQNATSLILPGGYNITTVAGDTADAFYLGSGNWRVDYHPNNVVPGVQTIAGGFKALKVTVTADTVSTITVDEITLEDSSGRAIRVSSVSVTCTISTSGANGLDAGSASGPNWYAEYVIWNPSTSTAACLDSLSFTAPTMPSGYTFKARVSAIRYDSQPKLWRMVQYGRRVQIIVGTNPATSVIIDSGIKGTYSFSGPTLLSVSLAGVVPSTAASIRVAASNGYTGGTTASVVVAPSTAWGGTNNGPGGTNGNVYPIFLSSGNPDGIAADIILEALSLAWSSNAGGGAISALGWEDNLN